MQNETMPMPTTTQPAAKKQYTRLNLEANKLLQLYVQRNTTWKVFADKYGASVITTKKHFVNPRIMDGYWRMKLASALEISVHELSHIIDEMPYNTESAL